MVGASIAAALGLIAWGTASFVAREPPHAPAFDEARDLPPLPAASENGWTLIAPHPESFFEPEPPGRLLLSTDHGPPQLAEWEAARDELERWELSPEAHAALDEVLARPRFVVACELTLIEPCPVLTWLRAHRAAAGLALRDAALGWDEDALARAERILRADRDALLHARTALAAMAAQAMTAEAIELASLLGAIVGAREAGAATPSVRVRLDALERALIDLEPATWTVEQALTGEAISIRRGLDTLGTPETWRFWLAPDLGRAARLLDEHMVATIRYARDPTRVAPPEPPRADPLWRALDPVGPLALEAMQLDVVGLVDRFEHEATQAEERIEAARVALAAARARIEHAWPGTGSTPPTH